jgi:hypothetical protein
MPAGGFGVDNPMSFFQGSGMGAPGGPEMAGMLKADAFGNIGAYHQDAAPVLDRNPANSMPSPAGGGGPFAQLMSMMGGGGLNPAAVGVLNAAKPESPPQQFQRAPQYPTAYAGLAAAPIGSSFRPQGV